MKTKMKVLSVLMALILSPGLNNDFESHLSINQVNNNNNNNNEKSKFKLVKSDDNIFIYSRWIHISENCSTRQLKVEFNVNCQSGKLISVLRNEILYQQWMKAVCSSYRLKTISPNLWYSYVEFSLPWPLKNQDCIMKYEVKELLNPKRTEMSIIGDPSYIDIYDDIERISHFEGQWVITPNGQGKTHVEYYVFSKQKPKFPTWITDPIIQTNLSNSMKSLKNMAINSK